MEKAIHNLGKDARLHIIHILLQNRSKKELADELGITPAAITKYLKGITHPSDEIIEKCIEVAKEDEYYEIIKIIISDITEALIELSREIDIEKIMENENVQKLKKLLDKAFDKMLSTSPSFV
ncbi:transcriptional regulator, XRE family [Sulfolobus islandicus Y.G.57.14]|jgi:predicted transcriptional regulator|uniref:XRE family transcriptional regulator n=10 Tax=Saccharolobus islandicus TaxID=43080 RepID=M9UFC7_SACIS|nr:helix-turn-helix transcriptional regulator [Sulfolobus islandicus]ACP36170.1 helix-turn-helix domain protein [Sulfolobus islandicus L.S.2.15]ACP38759.1 transcriptional regulator, XRE family [Sulfolobus islandicus M.14.25]ACP46393.1 transcriptional regulator, XRE family [Sulfolobus islandicus Y.G.57.14]ACP47900.1 transcriptional regulator, XRE family [Sulfolobus islandicus Y.N.15.51]ACP55963.1 transcriptional regulator, XRE family [Sulfolobus islandicus M.16.27]